MPTRTARTGWTGSLEQGVGQVELTSSKLATFEVSFPRRAADDAGGFTSPEELIAAAHSACYAMQLSALIGQAGGTPQALDVQADVSLGPDPAGGFRLTGIKLTVRGEVEGLNAEQFAMAAADAKAGVAGFVRALAAELGGTGVTANAVSPGSTATPILDESARLYGLPAAAAFAAQQPLGRLLSPAEVAAVIAFLAGDGASAMTGAVVPVDGGLTL